MHITLTTNEIANHLRQDQDASYSYKGSLALAEYLEELEESVGEPMELDVIAIRCEFTEYESLEEWAKEYFGEDEDEHPSNIAEYIEDRGMFIEFDGGVIVSEF